MKKLVSVVSIVLILCMLFSFAGCKAPEKASITVAALKGPTGVGMVNLMNENKNGTASNNYSFTVAGDVTEISGKIVTGEINIASVPTNFAAKINQKTENGMVMLAVNTLGVLSIVEKGNTVTQVADLKGKTIYSTGEGSNPEYILKYVLRQNNIDPDKDVTIKFVGTGDELTAKIVSGEAEVAMAPEPAATVALNKNKEYTRVLNMTEEWNKIGNGSQLMMGCVIAKKSFVEENKKAVENFLKDYEKSIKAVSENADTTAALCEENGIIPSAAIAKKALPNCNVTYVTGNEMKNKIGGYFEVLYNADKTSIGAIPSADFYYNAK